MPLASSNQLTIESTTLLALLTHAASAARIVGCLDDALVVGPLADHIDAIVHDLSELLGDPHVHGAPSSSVRSALASGAGGVR